MRRSSSRSIFFRSATLSRAAAVPLRPAGSHSSPASTPSTTSQRRGFVVSVPIGLLLNESQRMVRWGRHRNGPPQRRSETDGLGGRGGKKKSEKSFQAGESPLLRQHVREQGVGIVIVGTQRQCVLESLPRFIESLLLPVANAKQ